eukprot:1857773-Pleurochrysis_carterae.AAC.2
MGMWDELMATRAAADVKFSLATRFADTLAAKWGAPLTLFIKDELCLSNNDYAKLRLALCKRYDSSNDAWV